MAYQHQFTSPYPPAEFVARFTPGAVDGLSRIGYKLTSQTEAGLSFEHRYMPPLWWATIIVPIVLILALIFIRTTRTATITAEPYEHGSLVTVRGEADSLGKVFDGITVWQ